MPAVRQVWCSVCLPCSEPTVPQLRLLIATAQRLGSAPMELPGPWLAAEANDDIRRNGIGFEPIGPEWCEIEVPGQWQHHPKFASSNGPVLYRTNFRAPVPADGRRRWVTFDGVLYQ